MPNTETVSALVSAFNVNNYDFNAVKTNFMLQSNGTGSYIVVSFDKSMDRYQCRRYLDSIKRKIVGEFYGIEEGDTDEVVLNTANLIFNIESFPFNTSKGKWSQDEQGRIEFLAPTDKGVIFNLKSHLASSLVKDVLEDMPTCSIVTNSFNKGKYLCHSKFPNKELCKEFESMFLSRMKERYENVPKNPLKIEGNSVYIKDVFNDARFIDSITRRAAWFIGRDLQADSKSRNDVKAFKDLIMRFTDQLTGIMIAGFICTSPLGKEEASILIPNIKGNEGARLLTNEEAYKLNCIFNYIVFSNLNGKAQAVLEVDGSRGMYGIDFSNREISHSVITKIIESSVINKDHELSIDPELRLQALSPAQSPVRVPNGPSSGLTELSSPIQEFPTRSHGEELERSSRRESEKFSVVLHKNPLDIPGTSREFSPSTQVSYPAVSYGVAGPSSSLQSLSAAQNVQASTNLWIQQTNPCLSQSTYENKWQLPLPLPGPGFSGSLLTQSRPPSWKSADPVGANPLSQPMGFWSSPTPSAEPSLWQPSRPLSRKGANESGSAWTSQPIGFWSSPAQSAGFPSWSPSRPSSWKDANPVEVNPWVQQTNHWSLQSSNLKEDCKKIYENFEEAYEKIVSDSSLSKEEQELSEALLYWFNLNNFIMECPHTNFIVKNGKIASLINDGVDREKYLQAVRDYTIKEYYVTEKEACDLNEFPFKFLSNCEKNQETTVVANISRDALFNLKKLFIQEQKPKKKVKIEDINIDIVETAVKSKRKEWVDSQVREHGFPLKAAIESCYPDESVLKHISIIKDKGGYHIDHAYDSSEVKSLKKQLCTKGKSKA